MMLQVQASETEKYFQDVVGDPVSHETILTIIRDHLERKKKSARWIPKILTNNHKVNCLVAVAQFLTPYNDESEDLFDRIVTGDNK